MKSLNWLSLVLVMVIVLSACSSKGDNKTAGAAFDQDEKVTLKVLYFNEQAFYSQYGSVFQAKYPNIEFEVIPTMGNMGDDKDPAAEFEKLIEENKPDLIMMNASQYEKLSAASKLYALDSVIQQDKFDIENMVPAVIEFLKNKGGGKLYGLSPTFSAKALFYNKDLFDAQGLPYPTDKMSWEDVLKLAQQFPTTGTDDTRIYGLAQSMFTQDPTELVKTIADSKKLSILDAEGKNLTMDTPEWKSIFEEVVTAYQSNSVSLSGDSAFSAAPAKSSSVSSSKGDDGPKRISIGENSNLFLSGRAAMMIDSSFMLNQMDMMKNMDKDAKPINMGMVTEPVDPANPDMSDSFSVSQIFGVDAQSAHVGAAWEFIKYVHSDDLAKIRSKSSPELISRSAYAKDKQGNSLEAFYKLKPNSDTGLQLFPKGFREAFSEVASAETKAAISKSKSIDEAFAAIIEKGQKVLTEANISGEMETEQEEGNMMIGSMQVFRN
ncbi:extracellular solute-binding protein [Paenibacillus psychroresistens]|uniref:Extracellular solute-binding protein n=1 Tax=Paenibacillus psychroresistens TaxID=1778678 RepID=A0A6B8RH61_9BACL|nr:extracellular solute-binding protein [Paenibacillus psychroresistens]QGQ95530.1 extracellular solute-binding protein [Paenibacillus psychroresistens]